MELQFGGKVLERNTREDRDIDWDWNAHSLSSWIVGGFSVTVLSFLPWALLIEKNKTRNTSNSNVGALSKVEFPRLHGDLKRETVCPPVPNSSLERGSLCCTVDFSLGHSQNSHPAQEGWGIHREGGPRGQVSQCWPASHTLVPQTEQSVGSAAQGQRWPPPQLGREREKGVWAPERKLKRPLLPWGRKLPRPHPQWGPALRTKRSLLCILVSFSIHKEVGGGFPAGPTGSPCCPFCPVQAWEWQPGGGLSQGGPRDPARGSVTSHAGSPFCWPLGRKHLTLRTRSSRSQVLTQSPRIEGRTDIPFSRMGNRGWNRPGFQPKAT